MSRTRFAAKTTAGEVSGMVAVGASAGGLEAFTAMLGALPVDLGFAYGLVQHLQPGHPSFLAQILQKSTRMPVAEAKDGERLRANQVYVLPPGKLMTVEKGRLQLRDRPTDNQELLLPVDIFMRSVAAAYGDRAIGVVLSGSASDGTEGLLAIKGAGGICFAQSEETAEYASMSRAAIASGSVDYVLPPAEIAAELERLAHESLLAGGSAAPEGLPPATGRAFQEILELLRHDLGGDFRQYRTSTIQRRLARRLALRGLGNLEEYLEYLRKHASEPGQLFEDLLIPATRFFRDPEVFGYLKKKVLAALAKSRRPAERPIRIWSVGCSSGEEAYSLAMIALECLSGKGGGGQVQVFGTDLSETAVRRARAGRYGADIAQEVSAERLERFFVKTEPAGGGGGYRVAKPLRDACIFARHDITREAPFSRMDLICCRNVMIYMEPPLQRRIFPILHYALAPGGVLVLGSAESVGNAGDLFKPVGRESTQRKLKVYGKVAREQSPSFDLAHYRSFGHERAAAALATFKPRTAGDEAQAEADRVVLERFAPAGVVIDANLDIVQFRGRTSPYLDPAPGAASLSLAKLARGNLGAYVRSAVLQAQKTGASVRQSNLLASDGDPAQRELDFEVVPLREGKQPLFLVVFQVAAAAKAEPVPAGKAEKAASRAEFQRLRKNLVEGQRLIRTLSDEYQSSKQEYQAAAEEIASANEELQSTNEELETSKEELQSANEEINTINEELRHRNVELHQINGDLQLLLTVPGLAVLLLDRELRIRRFSPAAEKLLRLIPADVGRRIGDIRTGVPAADLSRLAQAAVASGATEGREMKNADGHWTLLRAHSYHNAEHTDTGVVVTLADINREKLALEKLEAAQLRARQMAEALAESATNPMALLNGALEVVHANQPFRELKLPPAWERGPLREALKAEPPLEFTMEGMRARVHRIPGMERDPLVLLALSPGKGKAG